jgi:hypothetical protein
MDMKKYITLLENNSKPKEVKAKPVQPKIEPEPIVHIAESYESSPAIRKIVRNVMEKKSPEPPKPRNPVAKNANAAVGGGAAGKHKDKKKDAKQGVQKHKGQQLDEYFEKEKPTDGELLLLMKKYRLAKISGKPLASVMRQSDIHKLIDAQEDGRIEQLKYKDSIDERYDDQELDEYFEKEKPTDGELLLLMKKYRLAKISGKPLGSVMRQSDIHKLIDAQEDGRIEALKYKDSIDERYDDEDDQEYTSKSDFKRHELEHELGDETRSGEVYIDGKYWKTFDTFKQAQNVARSLERKGKRATARMLESKKPKKTAQEKLSAAVERERKKNEPATKRAKQELDAIMPSKALAEGKVCPQCGSSKCNCPPGKCKCKPVAGFKPKMKEDKDPCWKNYKMVGTKKKGSKTVPNCVPKESRVGEAFSQAAADKNKIKYQKAGRIGHGIGWKEYGDDYSSLVRDIVNKFDNITRLNQYNQASEPTKYKIVERFFKKYGYPFELFNDVIIAIEKRVDGETNRFSEQGVAEGGEKYKIKSIGSDVDKESGERRDYYISPSTGKKVYKDGVKKGDHENPKSGEHKPKVEGRLSQAIMKEFGLK